jgi:hypothetical protein
MKNIITWTISLLMVTVLLAGCSSQPTATQTAPTAPAAATTQGYPSPFQPNGVPGISQSYPGPNGVPAAQSKAYPGAEQGTASNQNPTAGNPAQSKTLIFTLPGGINQPVTVDGLNALPTTKVNIEGKDQSLRSLADALKLVGASAYTKVTVNGQNGSLTITKDQVAQSYFDIQADGNIRLLVQGADPAQWPVGVTTIQVE